MCVYIYIHTALIIFTLVWLLLDVILRNMKPCKADCNVSL